MNLNILRPAARQVVHVLCDLGVATAYGLADTVHAVAAGITGNDKTEAELRSALAANRDAPAEPFVSPMMARFQAAMDAIPPAPPPLSPWWPEPDLESPVECGPGRDWMLKLGREIADGDVIMFNGRAHLVAQPPRPAVEPGCGHIGETEVVHLHLRDVAADGLHMPVTLSPHVAVLVEPAAPRVPDDLSGLGGPDVAGVAS